MKEKVLYSSAIIPNELYVERDADRKLKDIIFRMSKPAYVSVCRQMGKTNLLIHAKRLLEDENHRYVYIDITNKFDSARDCFRYIVNQVLESNEDIIEFKEAASIIHESRRNKEQTPSTEYQHEIKEILKKFKGKLIIFLDEVDDLRKHQFSDDIFGQIRKTYFINETHPVLKRITYVLSGVIDPEKLIKTKENSPFNIAIPILLGDFKLSEFKELINKSSIPLENDIINYIYDWLKGNPRMSFEILSLIEDKCIEGSIIDKDLIDKVIADFYLENFKNPPIDHIRDIVRHNSEIRKALIKLKKGQIEELSDDNINAFYLYGITSTKIRSEKPTIKNKVLELSLTDKWLENIELEKKGYYELGKEKIEEGFIREGIEYLIQYLQNEPEEDNVENSHYLIGREYNLKKEYQLSNSHLSLVNDKAESIYYWSKFYIGINYQSLEEYELSLINFEEVISDSNIPQIISASYVNKGEIFIDSNRNLDLDKIDKHYKDTINYIEKNKDNIENVEEHLSIIYYRLGRIYIDNNLSDTKAYSYFEKCLKYSDINCQVMIYLYMNACLKDEESEQFILESADLIKSNKLQFDGISKVLPPFDKIQLFMLLIKLKRIKRVDYFDELITYTLEYLFSSEMKEYNLIFELSEFIINQKDYDIGEQLLTQVLKYNDIDSKTEKSSHQLLGLIQNALKNDTSAIFHLLKYVNLFNKHNNFDEKLKTIDFNAFIYVINFYRNQRNMLMAYRTASIIEKKFDNILKADCILILFFKLDYYSFTGDIKNIHILGERILSAIVDVKSADKTLSNIDKKGLEDIEKQTRYIIKQHKGIQNIKPINISREPGRNEYVKVKYKDGREVKTKYKKIANDIKQGICQLIN